MLSLLRRQATRSTRFHSRRLLQTNSLLATLEDRGFVHQIALRNELNNALHARPQIVYAGIDPTAPSLHVGHLIYLMTMLHFQLHGHGVIPLIGGATGLVGDPSGRQTERQLADPNVVADNATTLTAALQSFFKRGTAYAASKGIAADIPIPKVHNNLEWHKSWTLLDFLQVVGVKARINTMLNRESVRTRLDSKEGLSFTEFTYQLLQAYDFYYLNQNLGCTIQIGGSDQWGNIIAGLELINRLSDTTTSPDTPPKAFAFTTPLLTTSSGQKFGKSAGNAVWLDKDLTSPYDFYQYFLRTEDSDVEKYLKLFTLITLPEITSIMETHAKAPEQRIAQKKLAEEVTELIHDAYGLQVALQTTRVIFGESTSSTAERNAWSILAAKEGHPGFHSCEKSELLSTPVAKLAFKYGLVQSNSAARNLIKLRGLYTNDIVVPEPHFTLTGADLVDDRIVTVRAGKKSVVLVAT